MQIQPPETNGRKFFHCTIDDDDGIVADHPLAEKVVSLAPRERTRRQII
jgi:hypothetical protein